MIDRLILKVPVFGPLFQKNCCGPVLPDTGNAGQQRRSHPGRIEYCLKRLGNKTIETAILSARASIREGETIAEPLSRSGVFPPMVIQMISVGESTGALDSMLTKIADFYEEEVDVAVGNLTSLLEPFLMVFLGGGDRRGRHCDVSAHLPDGIGRGLACSRLYRWWRE